MPRDFFTTAASVLPVLLLALIWQSTYLDRLRGQERRLQADDPVNGVRFWTKPRIRRYALTLTTVILGDTALCLLVLAGAIPDSVALRAVVMLGVAMALGSLLFRIWVEVLAATQQPAADQPDSQDQALGKVPGT